MTVDLESIKGRLVVSCQVYPGTAITHPSTITSWFVGVVEGC